MKDELGDRIKEYENVSNIKLMRKSYTILRLDGKAFHSYTKGLDKPFDMGFIDDMDETAKYLCQNIQGAKFGYVQSDEITILLTDFDNINTNAWFDNKVQKMCSVSASMATAKFNQLRLVRYFSGDDLMNISKGRNDKGIGEHFEDGTDLELVRDDISSFINYLPLNWKIPMFDSRVFQVPNKMEVMNTLIWRQQDTTKNSISSAAQTMFSHKELHGKSGDEKQEMMFQKGVNWNDYDPKFKRGRMIVKETYEKEPEVFRTRWVSIAPPIFTQDREYLK